MNSHLSNIASQTRKGSPKRLLGHLAALITIIMWGYSFVSTKVCLEGGMGPVEVYIYRFVIAYVFILLISHGRFRSHSWRDEGLFLLCGICSGSIYFIAENTALQYTYASNVSLLTGISPLFTVMLVGLFFRSERPAAGMYIGSAVAFVGVACVIFNSSASLEIRPLGDMLSLAAAVSWAIYSLILRRLTINYDAWYITRKTFFYGVVTAVPFLLVSQELKPFGEIVADVSVLGNLLFLAIGASLVGYLLWSVATHDLGAVDANNYMYFQSVVTMVVSFFVLSEPITLIGIIGCVLIIGGLWLGNKLSAGTLSH